MPHTTALVPIEVWAYQSPRLLVDDVRLDIGLLAEALIYYDRVLIAPASDASVARTVDPAEIRGHTNPEPKRPPFVDLVDWFVSRGYFDEFLGLVNDDAVGFYHCAFRTVPILHDGRYSLIHIQDQDEEIPNFFERRILQHKDLHVVLTKARQRERLYRAVRRRVTEVKASSFGSAIKNAVQDYSDPIAAALAVQALANEVHDLAGWPSPPQIVATISRPDSERVVLSWNIDLSPLGRIFPKDGQFDSAIVLSGLANSNRLIWSAAQAGIDLYLPPPLDQLVGTKLSEVNERFLRAEGIVDTLKAEVDFPNIRDLVNSGVLDFSDVLVLREKAVKFRRWLQDESDRDRNALIAYHHEIAKDAGLVKFGRHTLRLFGAVAGAAIGATALPSTPEIGAGLGGAVSYLADLASKLRQDWKPVVFGNWARDMIDRERLDR